MTRYGNVYFLSISIRKNMLLAPLYSISAIFNIAAAACKGGIEHLANTLQIIVASRNVQVPNSHNGNKIPLKNAAGLNNAFANA